MEELFCGSSESYPISQFVPKSRPWISDNLIGHIGKRNIKLPAETIKQVQQTFWDNLCSEYDAENFCLFLERHSVDLSPEFKAFEFVWRRDEYNHTLGFKHIYSILYDIPFKAIDVQLKQRSIDFSPI